MFNPEYIQLIKLLYEPDNHLELFTDMHKFYNAPAAIIQEPKKNQRPECWREGLELNTIEDWWNNDGGYGSMLLNLETMEFKINNNVRYTDVEEYSHDGSVELE